MIAHQPEFLYLADLADGDLDAFDTVILADRLHPELLRRHTAQILAVAERGGTLVVLGENAAHTWLPGVTWTARPTNFWWWLEGEDPLIRTRSPEHEAWEYLSTKSVIWHHHGLLHTDADVVPLLVSEEPDENGDLRDAGMMLFEDTVTTPGRIIATTLDPTYHHGNNFMPARRASSTRCCAGWTTPAAEASPPPPQLKGPFVRSEAPKGPFSCRRGVSQSTS